MNPAIKSKIAEINKLFEELDELAKAEAAPVLYPRSEQTGYIPEKWAARFQELKAKKEAKVITPEERNEFDEMWDDLPYPNDFEWRKVEAGPVWAPSSC